MSEYSRFKYNFITHLQPQPRKCSPRMNLSPHFRSISKQSLQSCALSISPKIRLKTKKNFKQFKTTKRLKQFLSFDNLNTENESMKKRNMSKFDSLNLSPLRQINITCKRFFDASKANIKSALSRCKEIMLKREYFLKKIKEDKKTISNIAKEYIMTPIKIEEMIKENIRNEVEQEYMEIRGGLKIDDIINKNNEDKKKNESKNTHEFKFLKTLGNKFKIRIKESAEHMMLLGTNVKIEPKQVDEEFLKHKDKINENLNKKINECVSNANFLVNRLVVLYIYHRKHQTIGP